MLRELILKNRSFRRFDQQHAVPRETLEELVDLARLSASGGNRQPLKYVLSSTEALNSEIFPNLAWAGYLTDWPGPEEGERPSAYIIMLCDTTINKNPGCDHGIAAQSIMLGAAEKGLGGCMIGSFDAAGLQRVLKLEPRHEIVLVLALGKPRETVVLDTVAADGSIKYWRDERHVHHVPKRPLKDLIIR
jgi:nitroreductase